MSDYWRGAQNTGVIAASLNNSGVWGGCVVRVYGVVFSMFST